MKREIEDTLDTLLPPDYDCPLYAQKCAAFEHLHKSYSERNTGIYAEAV